MANSLADKLNKRKQNLPTLEKQEVESKPQPDDVDNDIDFEKLSLDTHRAKLDAGWKRIATILPPEEHRAFKIAALKEDRDMSDIVRDLVKLWLSNT